MARRNLNFTLGYVRQWNLWEALRELLQNWADQKDYGQHPDDSVIFEIKRGAETGTLILKNHGVVLSTDTLALGGTNKAGGGFRGQYGEGMKLAWAVLYRLGIERGNIDWDRYIRKLSSLMEQKAQLEGEKRRARKDCDRYTQEQAVCDLADVELNLGRLETAIEEELKIKVYVRNGEERWIPYIGIDEGMTIPTLHVDTRKLRGGGEDSIEVRVEGITQAEWDATQANCLFLQSPKTVKLSEGEVLLDPEHAGKIFVKGLYVCQTPEKSRYGYNFNQLEISRDRGLADPWAVRQRVHTMIEEMAHLDSKEELEDEGNILDDLFSSIGDEDSLESKAVASFGGYSNGARAQAVSETMKQRFVREHGEDAFPVEQGEREDFDVVEAVGLKPVYVTRGMAEALKKEYNLSSLRDSKDVVKIISREGFDLELSQTELANLQWLFRVFPEARDDKSFRLVQFKGVGVLGARDSARGTSSLAIKALAGRKTALEGLVTAYAEASGTRTRESILTEIVLGLTAKVEPVEVAEEEIPVEWQHPTPKLSSDPIPF